METEKKKLLNKKLVVKVYKNLVEKKAKLIREENKKDR